jgi:hypothetical protein
MNEGAIEFLTKPFRDQDLLDAIQLGGPSRDLGDHDDWDRTSRVCCRLGTDGQSRSFEVMAISRPDGLGDIANLGITLSEAKQLLVQGQQQVVADQATTHAKFRPDAGRVAGQPRGAGLIIKHAKSNRIRVKVSDVDRSLSMAALTARFGPYQAPEPEIAAVEPSQAYDAGPIDIGPQVDNLWRRYCAERDATRDAGIQALTALRAAHLQYAQQYEFPSLGRLAVIEDALAKCAGFGIKAYLIMQDREQLLATYPHETILSNCHVRIAYAPNKLETVEWLSKELDTQTINLEVYSESGRRSGYLSQVSHSITQAARALMTPGEIMRLPGPVKSGLQILSAGELLLMTAGKRPIRGRQILYFEDPTFAARAAILPPLTTDTLSGPRFVLP